MEGTCRAHCAFFFLGYAPLFPEIKVKAPIPRLGLGCLYHKKEDAERVLQSPSENAPHFQHQLQTLKFIATDFCVNKIQFTSVHGCTHRTTKTIEIFAIVSCSTVAWTLPFQCVCCDVAKCTHWFRTSLNAYTLSSRECPMHNRDIDRYCISTRTEYARGSVVWVSAIWALYSYAIWWHSLPSLTICTSSLVLVTLAWIAVWSCTKCLVNIA